MMVYIRRAGLFLFIILWQLNTIIAFDQADDKDTKPEERAQVEVRAVFINCEPDGSATSDSDSMRFEREELFKHSVLRDCNKKLAVTVKITSEPDSSGDEYLPIEHVFEGTNKKRIRLLDPYILRLRREAPLQAYKLRRVDTISGILVDNEGRTYSGVHKHRNRVERDIEHSKKKSWTPDRGTRPHSHSVTTQRSQPLQSSSLYITEYASTHQSSCVNVHNNNMCTNIYNVTSSKRIKRSEHNIVVEEISDDSNKQWNTKDHYYRMSEPDSEEPVMDDDMYEDEPISEDIPRRSPKPQANSEERVRQKKISRSKTVHSKDNVSKVGRHKFPEKFKTSAPSLRTKEIHSHSSVTSRRFDDRTAESEDYNSEEAQKAERDYAVYEIGNPELWYTVHVQLFEKLSTPDGKTVWNDLTKGEQASVSSTSPEWTGQDLNVRYRPAEWIPRQEFSLPTTSLCLLAPIRGADNAYNIDNSSFPNGVYEDGGYIVIPEEDVIGIKDDDLLNKRSDENNSDTEFIPKSDEPDKQGRRKVVVRTSRALLGGTEEKVNIAFQGTDKYLTLPHRRPHHAQIDLEARADENELVRVGASGRIAIAVADCTRRTRTIITLQVGNTGLAAARFRAVTRDCGPALADLVNDKSPKQISMAGPALIPPRHTRSLRLELPLEIPIDVAHCSVSLMNDDDKSIAVREITIKKGDRCFCVWHCDCVCLTDDPKLICREMAEARQSAAGLSSRDRTRHARSACYQDVVTINIFIVVTGVILALLLLGFLKAFLGLIFDCIATWGLDQMVQIPRKIDHYYESELKCRSVEYDCGGYPVHPDTRERTVRHISRSMEFILNVIFFVSVPCIVICDAFKQVFARCKKQNIQSCCVTTTSKCNTKKCFSSQDMQELAPRWRRRRGGLRRWMTPQALELSKELWKGGLTPAPVKCEFMRPLLRDGRQENAPVDQHEVDRDSCADSEQDDTDYVLTQMQKSRESLSILKQKSKS